jgi:hypothetical protein
METRNLRVGVGAAYTTLVYYGGAARMEYMFSSSSVLSEWGPIATVSLLIVPSIVLLIAETGAWISRGRRSRRKPQVSWQEGLRT